MQRKKCIGITGADGRVARILRKSLKDDYDLKLFTFELPEGTAEETLEAQKEEVEAKVVDFAEKSQVEGCFEGVDVVIHLAAFSRAIPFPPLDLILRNNIQATYHVLEECVRANVKKVIFASTNHTQNGASVSDPSRPETLDPAKTKIPLKVSDVAFPDSLYGVSKLCGEDIGKLFALHHNLTFLALRIGWMRLNDDPSDLFGTPNEDYMRAMYLSHRDLINTFKHAIEVELKPPNGIPYGVAYACSNNDKCIWDLTDSIALLGYQPQDNSETFYSKWKANQTN